MEPIDRQEGHPLKAQDNRVLQLLGTLAPGPFDQSSAGRALAEFKANKVRRDDITMLETIRNNRRVQRVLAGIGAAALLIGLVAWTPVGALASEFLALFRVEKFVAVGVNPEQVDKLAKVLEQNNFFGEREVLEQAAEPVQVASLDEATQLVGFRPRQAAEGFGAPAEILVNSRTTMRFTPDVDALREIFTEVGLDPALVPENIDGKPFDITIPAGVAQDYRNTDALTAFTLAEMPSPTVAVPEGVDIKALGVTMLQLLGLPPQEAERMSNTIDWTTTLVLPIPTNMLSNMQEVGVRGSSGLMFWNDPDQSDHGAIVIWQEGGHLYVASGPGTGDVLAFIEGLR
jgi:hypothetical protein